MFGALWVQLTLQQLGVRHDAGEGLVEFVGRRPRQLGDEGLLLRARELLLGFGEALLDAELLAQVGEDPERGHGLAPLVDHRRAQAHRDELTVFAEGVHVRRRETPGPTVALALDAAHDVPGAPRGIEVSCREPADHVLGAVAVDPLGALVEQDEVAVHVGRDDPVHARVDQRLEELHRLDQLRLGAPLLGDVLEGDQHRALSLREARKGTAAHDPGARPAVREAQVDAARVLAEREALPEVSRALCVLGVDQLAHFQPVDLDGAADDLEGARVGEEKRAFGIHDRDPFGGRREEVGVALQLAHSALGFEAGERDLLRVVAQGLHHACVV